MTEFDRLQAAVATIRSKAPGFAPRAGIILGSGLGAFADSLGQAVALPYGELPGFPQASVPGHAGRLVLGMLGGEPIVAMQGRVHYYEGHTPAQVVFPARTLCLLGIRALVVTNAAGGIRSDLQPGDLMALRDHINLAGWNPLTGPNDDRLGPRFPDLSLAYSPKLLELLRDAARQESVDLREGIYASLAGPSYETPAEIRMLKTVGADAVGMSTVPEVIVAAHMGVPVAGISCITNFAAGIGAKPLSHEEVAETAKKVEHVFCRLLKRFLPLAARV